MKKISGIKIKKNQKNANLVTVLVKKKQNPDQGENGEGKELEKKHVPDCGGSEDRRW